MKKVITMYEALTDYFVKENNEWKCKMCGDMFHSITGVSVHWRKKHQHETKIFIDKATSWKK